MTRMATARRLATATAYGGGSVALGGAALVALLREEARAARRNIDTGQDLQRGPREGPHRSRLFFGGKEGISADCGRDTVSL